MRDPFAKFELYRKTVNLYMGRVDCAWCGNQKKTNKGYIFLYQYYTVNDDRPNEVHPCCDGKLFCSVGCMRNYLY